MNSLKLAEKFNKKSPAKQKKSKLDEHNDAIKYLIGNNHSLLSIQEFLEHECSCKIAYSTLRDYCNRRFNKKSELENKAKQFDDLNEYAQKIRNNYIPKEEHQNIKNIQSLIDYLLKDKVIEPVLCSKEHKKTIVKKEAPKFISDNSSRVKAN